MNVNKNTITETISDFISDIKYVRGMAENTCSAYGQDLTNFASYLQTNQKFNPTQITRDDIYYYLDYLHTNNYQDTSIARHLVAIKSYLNYLKNEAIIPINPSESIEVPRTPQKLPDFLTESQVMRLISGTTGINEVRNSLIIELLYASGLRATELIHLKITDWQEEKCLIRTLGKCNKERIIPISPRTSQNLRNYITIHRPYTLSNPDEETIFLSSRGTPLSRAQLWRIVSTAATTSGIDKEVHPHTLRHTFASHLLQNGADIRAIQELLGHSDIETTQIYTHVDTQKLLQIHHLFHPRQ